MSTSGLQELGFEYAHEVGGVVSEADYPYTSYEGRTGKCDTTKTNYIMGVNGYEMILDSDPAVTEAGFTSYMLSTGTISIGVDATTWNTYKGGIMADCGKGTDINHSVQLTGVDTEAGYWKASTLAHCISGIRCTTPHHTTLDVLFIN